MVCLWDSQLTTILCTYLEIHCLDPCFSNTDQNRKQSHHPTWPLRGSSHIQPALLPAPALHDEEWPQQLPGACESHAHSYPSIHSITEEAWFAGEVEMLMWRSLTGREGAGSLAEVGNLRAQQGWNPDSTSPTSRPGDQPPLSFHHNDYKFLSHVPWFPILEVGRSFLQRAWQ